MSDSEVNHPAAENTTDRNSKRLSTMNTTTVEDVVEIESHDQSHRHEHHHEHQHHHDGAHTAHYNTTDHTVIDKQGHAHVPVHHHHQFHLEEKKSVDSGEVEGPKLTFKERFAQFQEHRTTESWVFIALAIIAQAVFLVLFYVFVDYEKFHLPANFAESGVENEESLHQIERYYKVEMDVAGMVFIGFGFLMTFLKKYGYSSFGFNFLISALAFQWTILCVGFFKHGVRNKFKSTIPINIEWLIEGNFGAATVLISFGGVLGKVAPSQLIVMMIIEIVFYSLNLYIGTYLFKATDIGGSMFIHTFGAYFGLACSMFMTKKEARAGHPNQAPRYNSDLFSLIGTIFLWLFWPSFNGALALRSTGLFRSIINTFISLCGATVSTFIISRLSRGHFEMEDIQNATLAGGVAVGGSADLIIAPGGALTIGLIAGAISTLGFRYLTPVLRRNCFLHDTCGIHNLHGMPGVLGGLACLTATGIASHKKDKYGPEYNMLIPNGLNQPGYQMATLAVTLGISILSGSVTGILIRWLVPPEEPFTDAEYWCIPEEEFPGDEMPAEKADLEDSSDLKEGKDIELESMAV